MNASWLSAVLICIKVGMKANTNTTTQVYHLTNLYNSNIIKLIMFTKISRANSRNLHEWRKGVQYDRESRRRLDIEAVQPYVGALAVVSRFAGREQRTSKSPEELSEVLQKKAGEIATALSLGLGDVASQYTVQNIETGHRFATSASTETDWLKAALEAKGNNADIARTFRPGVFEDYPPHPALNMLSDEYRAKIGSRLEKQAGDRPICTSHLAYGAERADATPEHPYIAVVSFVAANIEGINDPRSATDESVYVLTQADASTGQISWDHITLSSDLHR